MLDMSLNQIQRSTCDLGDLAKTQTSLFANCSPLKTWLKRAAKDFGKLIIASFLKLAFPFLGHSFITYMSIWIVFVSWTFFKSCSVDGSLKIQSYPERVICICIIMISQGGSKYGAPWEGVIQELKISRRASRATTYCQEEANAR